MNARPGRAAEVILRAAIVAVAGIALVHPAHATFGTASISIDGGPLPPRGRVAFYVWARAGNCPVPTRPMQFLPSPPKVLVCIGVPVF